MLEIHPLQPQDLINDIIEWNVRGMGNPDELTIRYYDSVHDAVMTMSQTYNITPQHVIEEFCVDSDYPLDPNQPHTPQ